MFEQVEYDIVPYSVERCGSGFPVPYNYRMLRPSKAEDCPANRWSLLRSKKGGACSISDRFIVELTKMQILIINRVVVLP